MKRSSVRASLTAGATAAAASTSIRISSASKVRALDRLHDQNALHNAAIDERNAEERLVLIFAGFFEVFESRMRLHLLDRDRLHLLSYEAGQALMEAEAQGADAFGPKSERCGQDQIGAIRFEQIGGAHVGLKLRRDQRDDVHQGLGWFTSGFG